MRFAPHRVLVVLPRGFLPRVHVDRREHELRRRAENGQGRGCAVKRAAWRGRRCLGERPAGRRAHPVVGPEVPVYVHAGPRSDGEGGDPRTGGFAVKDHQPCRGTESDAFFTKGERGRPGRPPRTRAHAETLAVRTYGCLEELMLAEQRRPLEHLWEPMDVFTRRLQNRRAWNAGRRARPETIMCDACEAAPPCLELLVQVRNDKKPVPIPESVACLHARAVCLKVCDGILQGEGDGQRNSSVSPIEGTLKQTYCSPTTTQQRSSCETRLPRVQPHVGRDARRTLHSVRGHLGRKLLDTKRHLSHR